MLLYRKTLLSPPEGQTYLGLSTVTTPAIPHAIYREILRDNDDFMLERNLYSSEHFEFMV